MKVKGIKVTFVFLILALVLMPFPIYAAEQTQIIPTWNWGSQFANQFTVTNFCEGSGTSVSCELRFTANNSYYGYLSFDGYNGTTKWINYKNVWIADGYGAYRYSLYQNGIIQINKINIEGGFIKSSMDNLDLQDIIDLLTAIETDTTSIDNQLNTELQRIQSIINNQIAQNGYLETLTKLRQWNFPIESFGAIYPFFRSNSNQVGITNFNDYTFPIFSVNSGDVLFNSANSTNTRHDRYLIFGINANLWGTQLLSTFFTWDSSLINFEIISTVNSFRVYPDNNFYYIIKCSIKGLSDTNYTISAARNFNIMPIYFNYQNYKSLSTDFALRFNLSNELLDNLNIIAQGTQQSNSAASGLESSNSTMASDMNSMATIENGYSQDFNSQLQNIDFTNPIQQNQGILPAANFVISIFNGLISNNPFTVLIIIVCIMLIGKKVIGK